MERDLKCLFCEHKACDHCLDDRRSLGSWLTCCECGFGGLASVWGSVRASGPSVCDYCGHAHCEQCLPDEWPRWVLCLSGDA
jgi:hypothetical protein